MAQHYDNHEEQINYEDCENDELEEHKFRLTIVDCRLMIGGPDGYPTRAASIITTYDRRQVVKRQSSIVSRATVSV